MSATQRALVVRRGVATRLARRCLARRTARFGLYLGDRVRRTHIQLMFVVRHLSDLLRALAGQSARATTTGSCFDDPRYPTAVLNMMIYVGVAVNLKMMLAFLLSGFFAHKGWWTKSLLLVFILPWATYRHYLPYISIHWPAEWRSMGHAQQCPVLAVRHQRSNLFERPLDRARVQHRGLYLEDYAVLDDYPAGWKDGSPAGALRGSCGRWRQWPAPVRACDAAADGEPVYRLHTARYRLHPRRLQLDVFRFRAAGHGDVSTELLATLGILYAFTALPRLGVATVMTALPLLIPLVFLLMRKLRMRNEKVQLSSATMAGRAERWVRL